MGVLAWSAPRLPKQLATHGQTAACVSIRTAWIRAAAAQLADTSAPKRLVFLGSVSPSYKGRRSCLQYVSDRLLARSLRTSDSHSGVSLGALQNAHTASCGCKMFHNRHSRGLARKSRARPTRMLSYIHRSHIFRGTGLLPRLRCLEPRLATRLWDWLEVHDICTNSNCRQKHGVNWQPATAWGLIACSTAPPTLTSSKMLRLMRFHETRNSSDTSTCAFICPQ